MINQGSPANWISFFYIFFAKLYFRSNFRGSTRLLNLFFKILPFRPGSVTHPLGFSWEIDSRESLWTFVTSCEKYTTKIVSSQAPVINTFICIGANRGWYPLLVGQKNKSAMIIAFEPNSVTYRILERNVIANKNQSQLFSLAIGETESSANLFSYDESNDGMCTLYPTSSLGKSSSILEEVSIESLDHFLKGRYTDLGKSLILMDIEGSEMQALSGAKAFLEMNRPNVICEVNPILLTASGSNYQELFSFMHHLNYKAFWIDERQELRRLENLEVLPHVAILPYGTGANYLFVPFNGVEVLHTNV